MIETGDVIRLTIIIELPTSVIANLVTHLKAIGGTAIAYQDACDEFAAIIEDDFVDELQAITADNVAWDRLEMAAWDPVLEQWDGVATTLMPLAVGTATGYPDANANSILCKFYTDQARRQGRKYLPGIDTTRITNNVWDSTATTAALLWAAKFNGPYVLSVQSFNTGVWNETLGFKKFEQVVGVNDIYGTQRRRTPGVGS